MTEQCKKCKTWKLKQQACPECDAKKKASHDQAESTRVQSK